MFTTIAWDILKSKVGQLTLSLLLGMGVGAGLYRHFDNPVVITHTEQIHDTKEVTVNVPVLTEKVVTKIITDPKQQELANRVLSENRDLQARVTQLTSTVATNNSSGGGVVTVEPTDPHTPTELKGSFKDYQLEASFTQTVFSYRLNQTFRIVTTFGKSEDGSPISIIKLFQDTPEGAKVVPAQSVAIQGTENPVRFRVSPRIQAGLGIDQAGTKGGIVALQWLKRGSSTAAEDTIMAFLSPAVFISDSKPELTILPVSFNLGRIPRQPFTNIWLSPTVSLSKKLGVAITATF